MKPIISIKSNVVVALMITLVAVLSLTAPIGNVLAADYKLLEPLPCIPGGGIDCAPGTLKAEITFPQYVQYTINLVIAIAAAAAVFMIVYGGFEYMTSDAWFTKNEGKNKVKNALLGLVLVLCSYLILRTIDPRLVAIPSTLVPPLQIDKSQYGVGQSMFNDLTNYVNSFNDKLSEVNKQIIADVTAFRTEIAKQGINRETLCEKLRSELESEDSDFSGYSCNELMEEAFKSDLSQKTLSDIAAIDNNIRDQQIYTAILVGIGAMNDEILKCSAGLSFEQCRRNILNYRTNYNNKISNLIIEPIITSILDDYAKYAAVMAYANSQVAEVVENSTPGLFTTVFKDYLAPGATILANSAANSIPGPVSTIAGLATKRVTSSYASNIGNSTKGSSAAKASENIKTYTAQTVASIKDPDLKSLAERQIQEIIAGLKKK